MMYFDHTDVDEQLLNKLYWWHFTNTWPSLGPAHETDTGEK